MAGKKKKAKAEAAARAAAEAGGELATIPEAGSLSPYDYGKDATAGYEDTTAADYAIPFLSVLQTNSPQVEKGDERIKGAEAGHLFNTVSQELIDGAAGVIFVPCMTAHTFVEWKPRDQGGGYVGVHEINSDLVKACQAESTEFGKLTTDEGTQLVETFMLYGLLLRDFNALEFEMTMISFSSTKIKKYRQIMYRMRMTPGVPLFANRLRITTVPEKNNKGSFWNFKIEPAAESMKASLLPPMVGDDVNPLLLAAKMFRDQVKAGTAKASYESTHQDSGEGDEPF